MIGKVWIREAPLDAVLCFDASEGADVSLEDSPVGIMAHPVNACTVKGRIVGGKSYRAGDAVKVKVEAPGK